MVRVERFAPLIKLILSQPPLPIGLHAQINLFGTRERIRTSKTEGLSFRCLPDCITRADALPISDCPLPIYSLNQGSMPKHVNRKLAIENRQCLLHCVYVCMCFPPFNNGRGRRTAACYTIPQIIWWT